jgi:hypothetical protein
MKITFSTVERKVVESLLAVNHEEKKELPPLERLVWLLRQDQIVVPSALSKEEFDALFRILQLKHVLQVGLTADDLAFGPRLHLHVASDQQR